MAGVWVQKDVDTNYSGKMSQMNKEESIYGFIANTKATRITSADASKLQKYVDNLNSLQEESILADPTNQNRIILQIINQNYHEPIKANITYNKVDEKIEIRVTYTSNGISKILDEYGDQLELTNQEGIIVADTGSVGLAKGTYYFTVIDNKENQKELSITPDVDSLFKVAYINGTDNMDINATYKKTQETKTSDENTLLNQIKATDTSKTFSRAIQDSNKAITAIGQQTRTSEDEQWYMYGKYKSNKTPKYSVTKSSTYTTVVTSQNFTGYYCYSSYSIGKDGITLSGSTRKSSGYGIDSMPVYPAPATKVTTSSFYYFNFRGEEGNGCWKYDRYTMNVKINYTYSRGDFVSNVVALDGTYTIGSSTAVHKDNYWYVRNSLAPRYTLYKYDSDLNLKSTYDVDTKTLTTESIDISNKGKNKVKLTLNMYSNNYKVYISNDNSTWQEVTGISSGTPKELDVDGWDKLYVKVETNIGVTTNTTRINNIDVAYYKD